MNTYIIHATYSYTTKSKLTDERYSAQSRPTLTIKASAEHIALDMARKQMRERTGSEIWPVLHDSLLADLVKVLP